MLEKYALMAAMSLMLTIKSNPVVPGQASTFRTCSAVMITPTMDLSAGHCIKEGTTHVWGRTNTGKVYEMEFVYRDRLKDLILMRTKYRMADQKFAELGVSKPKVTEMVYTVSGADSMANTYSHGYVYNLVTAKWEHFIVDAAPSLPGRSGSGVFE